MVFVMALATIIVTLLVLTGGCVLSQSTVDDSDTSLQLQFAQLQQQHLQIAQVLNRLLENHQRQLNKLNELQTLLTNNLAHCSIEVQAYSATSDGTPRYGFVKLNAVPVWQGSWYGTHPNLRGVNAIRIDPFKCSVQESRHFDTYGDSNATIQLSNYLQQANRGNIIVGVTGDEPTHNLANARSTLRDIGADVADVQIRGSFAFVAQKGFPAKTVLSKAVTNAESNANPARFNATITGCSVDAFSITAV